jgi:hypothetical protein
LIEGSGGVVAEVAEDELARLAKLVDMGLGGTALLVAERGGGKTHLLRRLADRFDDRALILDCPRDGFESVQRALLRELDAPESQELGAALEQLGDRAPRFIAIDNYDRLARPVIDGHRELAKMAETVRDLETSVVWIVTFDRAAWEYIEHLRDDHAMPSQMIELPAWTEEQIGALIDLRTREAQLEPDFSKLEIPRQFDEVGYDSQEERTRFGIHRILWDTSGGNPQVAMELWADSLGVDRTGKTIPHLPRPMSAAALEAAHPSALLVLRMLLRAEGSRLDELIRFLGLPVGEVRGALHTATLRGWVELCDGRYRVTGPWFRPLTIVLGRRNLMPR